MKLFIIFIAFILLNSVSLAQLNFFEGSLFEAKQKAKEENKILMLYIVTEWCNNCIELEREVFSNPIVYEYANANQVNYKIDAEKADGVNFVYKYKLIGYPAIIFSVILMRKLTDGVAVSRIFHQIRSLN
jgi:thioredoxin-related protein